MLCRHNCTTEIFQKFYFQQKLSVHFTTHTQYKKRRYINMKISVLRGTFQQIAWSEMRPHPDQSAIGNLSDTMHASTLV